MKYSLLSFAITLVVISSCTFYPRVTTSYKLNPSRVHSLGYKMIDIDTLRNLSNDTCVCIEITAKCWGDNNYFKYVAINKKDRYILSDWYPEETGLESVKTKLQIVELETSNMAMKDSILSLFKNGINFYPDHPVYFN